MDFGFRQQSDATLFSDPVQVRHSYGNADAETIAARLAQIDASPTLDVLCRLPQARCHQPVPDRDELFSIDLGPRLRLMAQVADRPVPRLEDGGIDRSRVKRLLILDIAEAH